jgi:NAD(P)-dependent dehydrogenase (short-subunit alcohol dehydrogenase family)
MKNSVAIVTGASQGIGRSTVNHTAKISLWSVGNRPQRIPLRRGRPGHDRNSGERRLFRAD